MIKSSQQKWNEANKDKVLLYHATWRKNNRERIRLQAKKYREGNGKAPMRAKDLRIKYGLTPQRYDAMLVAQNNCCAICGKTPFENGKRLTIDHCHITKKVRGLLCYRCNTGLASFHDDASLLWTAYQYLAKSQEAIANAEGK